MAIHFRQNPIFGHLVTLARVAGLARRNDIVGSAAAIFRKRYEMVLMKFFLFAAISAGKFEKFKTKLPILFGESRRQLFFKRVTLLNINSIISAKMFAFFINLMLFAFIAAFFARPSFFGISIFQIPITRFFALISIFSRPNFRRIFACAVAKFTKITVSVRQTPVFREFRQKSFDAAFSTNFIFHKPLLNKQLIGLNF